jgi:hypothetical protein
MEENNSPVKILSPIPHTSLVLDTEAMKKLPESRADIRLWTMRRVGKPMPVPSEIVEKKAHFHSPTRICPWHGEVDVKDRNCPHKSLTSVEGLSCGDVLMISRIAGGKKPNTMGMFPKDFFHRGWLFIFKKGR